MREMINEVVRGELLREKQLTHKPLCFPGNIIWAPGVNEATEGRKRKVLFTMKRKELLGEGERDKAKPAERQSARRTALIDVRAALTTR